MTVNFVLVFFVVVFGTAFVVGLIYLIKYIRSKKEETFVPIDSSSCSTDAQGVTYCAIGSEPVCNPKADQCPEGTVWLGSRKYSSFEPVGDAGAQCSTVTVPDWLGGWSVPGLGYRAICTNAIYPALNQWMADSVNMTDGVDARTLGHKPLNQILLPGSHDTMTYALDQGSVNIFDKLRFGSDAPISGLFNLTQYPVVSAVLGSVIQGWAKAQNVDVLTQLNMGIRYLDLRLCLDTHYTDIITDKIVNKVPTFSDLKFTHSLICDVTLAQLIDQVATFHKANPNEIIILDFQYILNFSTTNTSLQYYVDPATQLDIQKQALDYIQSKLGTSLSLASDPITNTYNSFISKKTPIFILFDAEGAGGQGGTKNSIVPITGNTLPFPDYWVKVINMVNSTNNYMTINTTVYTIPPGNYTTTSMQTYLNTVEATIQFEYLPTQNQFKVTIKPTATVNISGSASAILGFVAGSYTKNQNPYIFTNVVNLVYPWVRNRSNTISPTFANAYTPDSNPTNSFLESTCKLGGTIAGGESCYSTYPKADKFVVYGATVGMVDTNNVEQIRCGNLCPACPEAPLDCGISVNYPNGLLDAASNYAPPLINNLLDRWGYMWKDGYFHTPTPVPPGIGTHNIFMYDNVTAYNVSSIIVAVAQQTLGTYTGNRKQHDGPDPFTQPSTKPPCCGDTPSCGSDWDEIDAPNTPTKTWTGFQEVCQAKGQRVCNANEMCSSVRPELGEQPLRNLDSFGATDNWMAVGDQTNEWVTYNRADDRLCKTHTQVAGTTPAWGSTTEGQNWFRGVKCCPPYPSPPSPPPYVPPAPVYYDAQGRSSPYPPAYDSNGNLLPIEEW